MKFQEDLTKELKEKADTWTEQEEYLKKEIETQEGLEAKYQEELDSEMEKGPASDTAAKLSLDLEYSKKRLAKAKEELEEHELTPLYSLEEYDKECNRIVNNYKIAEYDLRVKFQDAVAACLSILDEMESTAKEAGECERQVQAACKSLPESARPELRNAKKKGLYSYALPYTEKDWRKDLEDIERRLQN